MQNNINSACGRLAVVAKQAKERIERNGRIRTQQRLPQSGLADLAYRQILPLVPRITKTRFPVPSLEIIGKFSHLTLEADIKQRVPVGELLMSGTGIVNAAKPNSGGHRQTASVRKEVWNGRIGDCEGIKRIRDWHTDIEAAKAYVSAWDVEWVGYKRHSCQERVEK